MSYISILLVISMLSASLAIRFPAYPRPDWTKVLSKAHQAQDSPVKAFTHDSNPESNPDELETRQEMVDRLVQVLLSKLGPDSASSETVKFTAGSYHAGSSEKAHLGDLQALGSSHSAYLTAWTGFKTAFSKSYNSVKEEVKRFAIFVENFLHINRHNERYNSGESSYELGINQFTDLTSAEFRDYVNGFSMAEHYRHKLLTSSGAPSTANAARIARFMSRVNDLPASVDWRTQGFVTPVKNQGQCGSCWAFSTTGALEGQWFNKTKKLVPLSEQQLVDCSSDFGNEGCNGGLMDNGFDYIKKYGLESEASYPYKGVDQTCVWNKTLDVAEDEGHVDIPAGNESALQAAVAMVGPVSVAIDASHMSFQFYKKGVYNEKDCHSDQLDHGVLIIGYGSDAASKLDYWIVKNSWGTQWGQVGYVWMTRNKDNQCGIASAASYPIVD